MQTGLVLEVEIPPNRKRPGPVERAREAFFLSCNQSDRAGQRAKLSKVTRAHLTEEADCELCFPHVNKNFQRIPEPALSIEPTLFM